MRAQFDIPPSLLEAKKGSTISVEWSETSLRVFLKDGDTLFEGPLRHPIRYTHNDVGVHRETDRGTTVIGRAEYRHQVPASGIAGAPRCFKSLCVCGYRCAAADLAR